MELITTTKRAQAVQVTAECKPWADELSKYTPVHIQKLLNHPAAAVIARPAPTLAAMFKKYGHAAPMDYITACLQYTAEAMGMQFENSIQIIATANGIYNACYGWTLAEILAFFAQFIAGRYGRFYGRFDNAIIYDGMQRFWRAEVAPARAERERQAENARRQAWAAEAVTPDEFAAAHDLPDGLTVAEICTLMHEREQASTASNAENVP